MIAVLPEAVIAVLPEAVIAVLPEAVDRGGYRGR